MSDCKELGAALARLSSKIDGFNQQLTELKNNVSGLQQQVGAVNSKLDGFSSQLNSFESRISKLENKGLGNQQNNPTDLSPIYKRLSKLETYCQSVENFFVNLRPIIKIIVTIFV